MKIIFFSDTHISRKSVDRMALTLRFITDYCDDADMVFIVGDLFEFYHGYDNYIYPWYNPIADTLKNLVARGKSIFFLEGNHEFSMGRYFEEHTGVTCARELSMEIEGKKVYVAHGDGFSRFSLARLLKRPFFYRLMDHLGPAVTWKVAMFMHPFLSRREKGYSDAVQKAFRAIARAKFSEGHDVVILAHSHMPDVFEMNEGAAKKIYLNTGDLVTCASFVSYETSSGFSLKKCSTEGVR